ncbi:MAG: PBSX family phage terminase large subunit [Candidatus Gastranaerophilales bacterium]|nr:PBSX family phage terminase large subunit [Candidatus Gastranaerophilales bacterium]
MNVLKLSPVFEKIARAYKKYRYIINQGGTSSTKTFSTLQFLMILAIKRHLEIDIVGLTQGHLKSGVLLDMPKVMNQFGLNFYTFFSKTNKTLELPSSCINFISVDTFGKAHGGRRDILYLNEANHLNYQIAQQLMIRTREKIFIDFNPTSRFWVHDEILANEQKNAILIKSTYKDNPFLEKEIVQALESRMKDENFWRVYGLGEIGVIEGRVFTNLQIKDFDKNAFDKYYNGIDWGFSTDPFAFIRAAKENDILYITDEIYSTNLLNKDSIPLVKNIIGFEYVTCDSSEPKSISEFQSSGVNALPAKKGRGSIESGIKYIQSFSKIYIHPDCKNAQKEFFNYCFKKNLNGEIIPVPQENDNHLVDALRYALEDLTGGDTISVIKGLRL